MHYVKVGAWEIDLSRVEVVDRAPAEGPNTVVLTMGSGRLVGLSGPDADAFLAAWRSYVAEYDGPRLRNTSDYVPAPAAGESRDLPGSDGGG